MIDYPTLYADITTGVLAERCAEHIVTGNDTAIADICNDVSFTTQLAPISIGKLLRWAAANGVLVKIQDAANTPGSPMRAIAQATMLTFTSPHTSPELDLSEPETSGMLDILVQAGLIAPAECASLMSLALAPISYAQKTWGRALTARDIGLAFRSVGLRETRDAGVVQRIGDA